MCYPKIFPYGEFLPCMKLTKTKLLETIRRKNEEYTTYQARKVAGISIRRVNQIWKHYTETGEIPDIGKDNGGPLKMVEQWEFGIVKEAYEKYRVSADTLERIIDRDYGKHISHNRIHKIMLMLGFAKKKSNREARKKKIKWYERRHSLTAVHVDWTAYRGKYAFGVEDDASRKILALIEHNSPTTNASIQGMIEAMQHGKIKQCICDHGPQFIKQEGMDSRFKAFLEEQGIKQIVCRVRNPRSNGKIEKWFGAYKKHRHAFKTKEEFIHWYTDVKPHRSLNFDVLETPSQAFIRKRKAEA